MTAATLRGHFVLLRAGTLRLLLRQSEVGAVEYLIDTPVGGAMPGLLRMRGGGERIYAALGPDLSLLCECPRERFVAAPFASAGDGIAWCWDELRVLIDVELQPIPVPASLLRASPPAEAYVELDGAPAFLCDAVRFAEYVFARAGEPCDAS
jgi:hypothetical protein